MKFAVVLALCVALCSCSDQGGPATEGGDGSGSPSGGMGIGKMIEKYINLLMRFMKFREAFEKASKAGELKVTKDNMREYGAKAIEDGRVCLETELKDGKGVMDKWVARLKSLFQSGSGKDGGDSQSGNFNFGGIMQLFAKLRELANDEELKKDFQEVRGEVGKAFGKGVTCFKESMKTSLGDNFEAVKKLWDDAAKN